MTRLPRGFHHIGIRPTGNPGRHLRRAQQAEQRAARRIEAQEVAQAEAVAQDEALGSEERARNFTALLHDALAHGITLDVAVEPHFRATLSIKSPTGW